MIKGRPSIIRTIAARWIFPGTSPPIRDGRISIQGGKIVRVGGDDPAVAVDLDLGDVAIIPGFVNAHIHLELDSLPWDEANGPENQIAWLGRVIRSRGNSSPPMVSDLIHLNLQRVIEAGTTALGDITTAGQSWQAVAGAPVWGTVFTEVLGLSATRSHQTWQTATDWLAGLASTDPDAQTRPGLSPHAPYSTAGWLYHAAAERGLPLATHLGELPAEREFLTQQSGPLRQFVQSLGAWAEGWRPMGSSPVDYLDADTRVSRADWIVAHGNIFEPPEFARLRPLSDDLGARRVAVAYCPRTHARFGHPPHPFRAMLDAGVMVCLGTDSLGSTPTLSILDEVRFLHQHHPDVPGATLLRMATSHGAWALRLDSRTGSLEPEKSADLAVLGLKEFTQSDDPHQLWLDDPRAPLATMFRGQFVAGPWT